MRNLVKLAVLAAGLSVAACDSASIGKAAVEAPTLNAGQPGLTRRAIAKLPGAEPLPAMHWDGRDSSAEWTDATLAALDSEGAVLNIASREYPLEFPHPGWSQQKPEDWQKPKRFVRHTETKFA